MSFATLRGVTRRFVKGEHEVVPLHQVDLDIGAGEFLVLLGPSGSGKTTILRAVTARLRLEGKVVATCASTAIAALLHEGGALGRHVKRQGGR